MIAHGLGLIVIPEKHVPEFKKKLVTYYESSDIGEIPSFSSWVDVATFVDSRLLH